MSERPAIEKRTLAGAPIDLGDGRRLVPFIDRARIATAVAAVARAIDRDFAGRDPLLVGVLKGAYPFLADLSRALTTPHRVDFLRVASYGAGTVSTGPVAMIAAPTEPLDAGPVIVVEDILDSGRTWAFIGEEFARRGARDLHVAMLLRRRSCPVAADYVGLEIDEGFVVGYGMDLAERFRHLPDLYVVEEG